MDSASREKEKLHTGPSPETLRKEEKPKVAPGIEKKAKQFLEASGIEDVEGQEGVEMSEGKVTEAAGEDKAYAPTTGGPKAYSADEIEAIRAKLLAALPPQHIMIREIRNKLYKREKVLTKRMNKLQKKSHMHAFELTIVVSQLRKVREYFSMLAHATFEIIKHLWLKIVHGV